MHKSKTLAVVLGVAMVSACSGGKPAPDTVDVAAIEAAAHGGYVAAINSNDTEKLKSVLTDDVVYQAPGAPELIGYLQGKSTLSEAIEAAILQSRRYAKRQRTWFRSRMGDWRDFPCN